MRGYKQKNNRKESSIKKFKEMSQVETKVINNSKSPSYYDQKDQYSTYPYYPYPYYYNPYWYKNSDNR